MPDLPVKTPLLERPVHPWIQGLLLGVSIGAAFVGGWWLAKSGYESKDGGVSSVSPVHAAQSWETGATPVSVFQFPAPGVREDAVETVSDETEPADNAATPGAPVNAKNAPAPVPAPDGAPAPVNTTAPAPSTPPVPAPAGAEPPPPPAPPNAPESAAPPAAVPEAVPPAVLDITTEPGTKVFLQATTAAPTPAAAGTDDGRTHGAAPAASTGTHGTSSSTTTAARAASSAARVLLGVADGAGRLAATVQSAAGGLSCVLVFEHPDYLALARPVTHTAGRSSVVEARMSLKPGSLAVFAMPAAAEVFVDGEKRGNGVVTFNVAPRVKHRIEVRLPGAASSLHEVEVAPGATRIVRANLLPPPPPGGDILFLGAMRALALRADATVRVDGAPVRAADGLVRDVAPGRRRIAITVPGAAGGKPEVLWERVALVNSGSAVSFGNADAPGARVAPLRPAPALPATVGGVSVAESVQLRATLLDERGLSVPLSKARVTFNGLKPPALPDGALLLPVDRGGTLEVSAPGYLAEERVLRFPAPGVRYLSIVLRGAPKPVSEEWRAAVKAVSAQDAVLVLSSAPERPLASGQSIALVPATAGAGLLKLSILQVGGGNIVCQVLPGQTGALPGEGSAVTVRFLGLAPTASP